MNRILIHVDRNGSANLAAAYNVCSINRTLVHADALPKNKKYKPDVDPDLPVIPVTRIEHDHAAQLMPK
ncbi:hypothetical protein J23TS9_09980 [Paenibacillus sp. J23TS9]|nr:hypothetical protein J23TS9_09980 [Paenibacillus sp. J23TS9]